MALSNYNFLFIFLPLYLLILVFARKCENSTINILLTIFNFIFYALAGIYSLVILLLIVLVSWIGGNILSKNKKKFLLILFILIDVLVLVFFKYFANFMSTNGLINFVSPLGLSFYIFQSLSYLIDIYRKDYKKNEKLLNVMFYLMFFPKILSGPIEKYDDINNQFISRNSITNEDIVSGIQRFLIGLTKKVVLADTFIIIADEAFSSNDLTIGLAWAGLFAYALQIYYDFSGYSDMAIGVARMAGFKFKENFNYPYIATNITDFWRRWHISLSTWFKNYIYIPLGGNRCSILRNIFNLLVVWLLTGIWHGSTINFVLWGLYYFVFLVIEKYILKDCLKNIPSIVRRLVTLLIVMFGWAIFRSESIISLTNYIKTLFGFEKEYLLKFNDFARYLSSYLWIWIIGIIGCTPIPKNMANKLLKNINSNLINMLIKYFFLLILLIICYTFIVSGTYQAFVYFNF